MKRDLLKKPIGEALEEFKKVAPFKLPDELTIKHPGSDAGIHVRDDGKIEIFAGGASIILDSTSSNVIISCNEILTAATAHRETFTKDGGLFIDNSELDPFWYRDKSADIVLPASESSLSEPYFITGTPAQGQWNAPLSDLLTTRRLFKLRKKVNDLKAIL